MIIYSGDHFNFQAIQRQIMARRRANGADSTFKQSSPLARRRIVYRNNMRDLMLATQEKYDRANMRLNLMIAFPQFRSDKP